ncbi:cobalamin synthase [Clostridium acetireducens DSM 10703]|uniref:Adenosylcobinamide-GDP ribazoletransferase n=1 Tax=Clostridium acetireducens DSM 10703 TaxID=1121290 RepID=A0A1E8EZW5_9CLOT|nr:adenosylcobinamide-GDP ribazoletransferase [Clostridium acetireducens]OFI06677.1 cobalamin synthase [Clostridium acetireducens DSM 10703]
MRKHFQNFLLMIQFMTRIPIKLELPCSQEDFKNGTAFFPLVGFTVGMIQWIVYIALMKILPPKIVMLFVVLIGILITGAFHIDGFGDTCDGFFACKGKDKVIEIMKDSRVGAFACIAIVFNILFKYECMVELLSSYDGFFIVGVPIIGRFSITILAALGVPAKESGTGNLFIRNIGKREFLISFITTIVLSSLFLGVVNTAIIIPLVFVVTFLFNRFCLHNIKGITGDSFGANNEIIEIFVLTVLLATAKVIL